MENTLKLQQIKCANCGGTLSSYNPFLPTVTCTYCGTLIQVTSTMTQQMQQPERIIPFSSSQSDFEKEIINLFVASDYCPNNILDNVSFESVDAIYLPMFLYEGKYEASWSCSVGYEETEVRASSDGKSVRNKTVLKWRPQSGTTKGNFGFVCLAYEGQEISPELAAYTRTFPYEAAAAREFSPDYLAKDNLMIMPHNMDSEATWSKHGEETISDIARNNAIQQVASSHFREFSASVSHDLKNDGKGRLVFIPFWFVYYNYNSEKHYAIMDGIGKTGINGSTPIDKERVASVKSAENLSKYGKWGAIALSAVTVFLFGPMGAAALLIPLVAWIAFFVLKMVSKSNVKKIIETARCARRELLKKATN